MTLDVFFEELFKTKDKYRWHITKAGRNELVRAEVDSLSKICPITAVCLNKTNRLFDIADFDEAAKLIELSEEDLSSILIAADFTSPDSEFDKTTRQHLLSILDLRSNHDIG